MHFTPETEHAAKLYLRLLKRCLTRTIFPDKALRHDLVTTDAASLEKRQTGSDWPTEAETMVGMERLDNIEACGFEALRQDIEGDFVETGVWRGGASIFMRGILKAYGIKTRRVWVADSFEGLPKPDPDSYPKDAGDEHHTLSPYLAVSLPEVKKNFERYELLDDQVVFLPGWFKDSLPAAPVKTISLLRLDGDMYESTMEALVSLYDRVTPGGYVIIDDYGCLPNCKAAVDDFRQERGISDPIQSIDWTGVFWKKTQSAGRRSLFASFGLGRNT